MDDFYVWQPTLWASDLNTLDVIVTRGESYSIGAGSPEFIDVIIKTLGLAKPQRTKVIPFRSQRFNDDLDVPDWRDRWSVAWSVLFGYGAAAKLPPVKQDPTGFSAYDETFAEEHKHWNFDNTPARVLADFSSEEKAVAGLQKTKRAGRIGRLWKGFRVEVEAGFISNADPDVVLKEAAAIQDALRKAGGITNLREE